MASPSALQPANLRCSTRHRYTLNEHVDIAFHSRQYLDTSLRANTHETMSEARPTRTLLACVAGVTLVFVGIATWNDETLFSAMRYGVVPAGIAISQIAYSRTGPDAGFGTAISLAVPIMTLAASLRYALWPNETESAVAFIGITGIVMGLLWGVVMPIFTPPNRNSTD